MSKKSWPYTTPTGFVYCYPSSIANNIKTLDIYMIYSTQGEAEGWDATELPPEPTWEMVSDLLEEIRVLTRLASRDIIAEYLSRQLSYYT